jgi:hypothetical protein
MSEVSEVRFFDDRIRFLDNAVASQRAALRFQFGLACVAVGLGLAVILAGHLLAPESPKWPTMLGGFFLPTLSSFPLKEVFTKRDRIAGLIFLRNTLLDRDGFEGGAVEGEQWQRAQDQFWELLRATLAIH